MKFWPYNLDFESFEAYFREIPRIQEFNLVIILAIFPQKWQLRLKNENSEIFSEFSLTMTEKSHRKWANTNFFLELYFYSALNYIISSCPFLYYKSRKMNYCSKISIYIDKTWYLHCTHVTNTEFDVEMAVLRIM